VTVPAPLIVVEVLSPSTANPGHRRQARRLPRPAERPPLSDRQDGSAERDPSSRGDGDLIETPIVTAGLLQLDPPGITLDLDRIYG